MPSPKKPNPKKTVSFIAAGTRIIGDIEVAHELWVEGSVEGRVTTTNQNASVLVARDGVVRGEVRAPVIQVLGQVDGDIVATRSIRLEKTARVSGDLSYQSIEIEPGAIVTGAMRRLDAGSQELRVDDPKPSSVELSRRQS